MLYIVSTPIGNIKDITLRALDILKEVDYVLAEDTRRTGTLLSKYDINKKIVSYNDYNKEKKTPRILQELNKKKIALVSDAGTPGISDPGFYLVRESIKRDIKIIPIPGPSAVISGLVVSGLPTDKFTFYGFVPKKKLQRKKLFEEIESRKETAILFDSPYRVKKNIEYLSEKFPKFSVVIAREMTKKFEEILRGKPEEIYDELKDRKLKGEITLIVKVGKLS